MAGENNHPAGWDLLDLPPAAGTVTVDFALMAAQFTSIAPLNVTNDGFVTAQISDGANFGIAVFRVNDLGVPILLGTYDQAGTYTAGATLPVGWTISGASGGGATAPTGTTTDTLEEITTAGAYAWSGTIVAYTVEVLSGGTAVIGGVTVTGPKVLGGSVPDGLAASVTPLSLTTNAASVVLVFKQVV